LLSLFPSFSAEMMQSRRKRSGQSKRKPQRQGDNMAIPHPPQIQSLGIVHSTKLRFITGSALNQLVVTFQNLLDSLNVAATTVTAYQLFQAVRIRAVELWANPAIGTAATVQCEFVDTTAGVGGDARIHSDTSMGVQPAHVRAKPAARSGLALFNASSANPAFILTCPTGTVVDVELAFRGLPGFGAATQNAPVGVVVGAWYYRGLDGLAIATTKLVPVINLSGSD
jgi:hypothetical protein